MLRCSEGREEEDGEREGMVIITIVMIMVLKLVIIDDVTKKR